MKRKQCPDLVKKSTECTDGGFNNGRCMYCGDMIPKRADDIFVIVASSGRVLDHRGPYATEAAAKFAIFEMFGDDVAETVRIARMSEGRE